VKVILLSIKGAFGVVYKAIHNTSKNVRAIKMIKKNNVTSDMHRQLLKEIQILKEMVT
jgi:serine/threonine protein kinase